MTVRSPRRELAVVVVLCAAGAALVLYATSLTWATEVVARPAPLPDERIERDGGDVLPWLPALGWVALAGAGMLLATRGRWRQGVGALLSAVGLGMMIGASWGVAQAENSAGWPAIAAFGGLVVAAQGVVVVRRSQRWPAMGARYERSASHRAGAPADQNGHSGPTGPRAGGAAGDTPTGDTPEAQLSPEEIWQALDRGEDPTS